MRKFIVLILAIIQTVAYPFLCEAYDLSRELPKGKPPKTISVALVPFAEKRSPELDRILGEIEGRLHPIKDIRLLDRSKTDTILQYYLDYVHQNVLENDVEKTLMEAKQSFIEDERTQALALLNLTEKKIGERVEKGGSNEGLHQVYLLRAKINRATGNEKVVKKEYDKLVSLAPNLTLDPNLYATWELKALKDAKGRLKGSQSGSIHVSSDPEGSEVFLNGIHQGITPMTLQNIPPSVTHIVEVKSFNHNSFLRKVVVEPGSDVSVDAPLTRTSVASDHHENTIKPSLYTSDMEISKLISTLGYHLGVDKVILVADKSEAGKNSVIYRLGDSKLGAVQKQHEVPIPSGQPKEGEGIGLLVASLKNESQTDILRDPHQYADQTVGNEELMEKRKKEFYKKPLFWVLVGATVGTGGALAAVLGSTAAATATTGGAIVSF